MRSPLPETARRAAPDSRLGHVLLSSICPCLGQASRRPLGGTWAVRSPLPKDLGSLHRGASFLLVTSLLPENMAAQQQAHRLLVPMREAERLAALEERGEAVAWSGERPPGG